MLDLIMKYAPKRSKVQSMAVAYARARARDLGYSESAGATGEALPSRQKTQAPSYGDRLPEAVLRRLGRGARARPPSGRAGRSRRPILPPPRHLPPAEEEEEERRRRRRRRRRRQEEGGLQERRRRAHRRRRQGRHGTAKRRLDADRCPRSCADVRRSRNHGTLAGLIAGVPGHPETARSSADGRLRAVQAQRLPRSTARPIRRPPAARRAHAKPLASAALSAKRPRARITRPQQRRRARDHALCAPRGRKAFARINAATTPRRPRLFCSIAVINDSSPIHRPTGETTRRRRARMRVLRVEALHLPRGLDPRDAHISQSLLPAPRFGELAIAFRERGPPLHTRGGVGRLRLL